MSTKIVPARWAGLCLTLAAAAVQAAPDAQALQAQALAATCANCHGTEGRAVEGSLVPGLAGQPAPLLAELLRSYKSGSRAATVMRQLAKGYSEAQIDALAAYFAARPR